MRNDYMYNAILRNAVWMAQWRNRHDLCDQRLIHYSVRSPGGVFKAVVLGTWGTGGTLSPDSRFSDGSEDEIQFRRTNNKE
jgi:hypothetical protein